MFEIIDSEKYRTFVITSENISPDINIFEHKINEFIRDDNRDLALDMKNVLHLDSVTLAALIRFRRKLSAEGRGMKLMNFNESILRVIELSGMDDFLLG